MKENREKKIETFVYGLLSLMFGAAFFFGVLYPSQGISPNAYRVTDEQRVYIEQKKPVRGCPYATFRSDDVRKKISTYEQNDIRYTFYLYERLKNS